MHTKKRTAGRQGGRVEKSTAKQQRRSARIRVRPQPEYKAISTRRRTSAAHQAVWNTAELLENILIYVPFHTLLTAQRVCSLWRDAINQSTTIKQKLFLSPKPIVDRWAIAGTMHDEALYYTKVSPTVALPQGPETSRSQRAGDKPGRPRRVVYPVRLHPLLEVRKTSGVCLTDKPPFVAVPYTAFTQEAVHVGLVHDLQRNCSTSSWHNMYLCNPPCISVSARITFERSKVPVRSMRVVVHPKDSAGVTFGHLIDRASDADMEARDGKEIRKGQYGHCSARQYLEETEALHERPARVGREETGLTLSGCVAPSEEEWEAVRRTATIFGVAIAI